MADIEWPWQYEFPPFFTIQPHAATREKQLDAWHSLVLAFCRAKKQYILDVTEAQSSPLFNNKNISRQLPLDGIKTVLDYLQSKGNLEWLDKEHERCLVYWRTPKEWASLLYSWVMESGMTNTVCTLFELTNGEDTVDQDFYGLEKEVLIRSLQVLEAERKAEMIVMEDCEGVKFF